MKKSFLHLPILACAMLSCTGTEKEEQACLKTITVDTKNPITTYKEVNLIEDVKLLPLGNEVSVGGLQKLKIIKDRLIISDYQTSQIIIFSMHTGAVTEKINKKGNGPDEYNRIDDFYVDEALQYIEVLDGATQKVLRYDLTGKFIKSTKLPFGFNSFSKIKEDYIFAKNISLNEEEWMYQLFIWNEKDKVKDKYIEIPRQKTNDVIFASKSPLQRSQSSLIFQPIYIPKIYHIDEKFELIPKYCLDFGSAWITDELAYANTKGANPFEHMQRIYKSGKAYFVNFLEGDEFALIYFNMGENNELYVCMYHQKTETSQVFKADNSNLCLGNEYVAYHDGYFVCIKQPFQLKEYLKNNSGILSDKQKSMIEKSEETDNPILMLTKFKDKVISN